MGMQKKSVSKFFETPKILKYIWHLLEKMKEFWRQSLTPPRKGVPNFRLFAKICPFCNAHNVVRLNPILMILRSLDSLKHELQILFRHLYVKPLRKIRKIENTQKPLVFHRSKFQCFSHGTLGKFVCAEMFSHIFSSCLGLSKILFVFAQIGFPGVLFPL